jgi:predicted trehalose synthase
MRQRKAWSRSRIVYRVPYLHYNAHVYITRVETMKTERMTILVTPEQKAAILARAERLGVSAGEMVRRAVESYDPAAGSDEDQAVFDALADELFAAAEAARTALRAANEELQSTLQQLAQRRTAAENVGV